MMNARKIQGLYLSAQLAHLSYASCAIRILLRKQVTRVTISSGMGVQEQTNAHPPSYTYDGDGDAMLDAPEHKSKDYFGLC